MITLFTVVCLRGLCQMRRVKIIDKGEAPPKRNKTSGVLDETMMRRFCRYVREGLPIDTVCNLLCLSRRTFWVWLQKGGAYIEGNNEPSEHAIYGEFVTRFRKAFGVFVRDTHRKMNTRGNHLWTREMTILERRDRKNYGRKDVPGGSEESFEADERFI